VGNARPPIAALKSLKEVLGWRLVGIGELLEAVIKQGSGPKKRINVLSSQRLKFIKTALKNSLNLTLNLVCKCPSGNKWSL
jgi:hypothetical protein